MLPSILFNPFRESSNIEPGFAGLGDVMLDKKDA